jgi:hypothetical protein
MFIECLRVALVALAGSPPGLGPACRVTFFLLAQKESHQRKSARHLAKR